MSEVSLCKRDSYKIRTENEVIVSKTSIVLGRTISVSPDSFRRDADVNLCLSIKYYKIYKFHKYNHKSQEKQGNEREGNGGMRVFSCLTTYDAAGKFIVVNDASGMVWADC